jgi:hypothetical protein
MGGLLTAAGPRVTECGDMSCGSELRHRPELGWKLDPSRHTWHRIVHVVNRFPDLRLCPPLAIPDAAARSLGRLCERSGRWGPVLPQLRGLRVKWDWCFLRARENGFGRERDSRFLLFPRALAEADPAGAVFSSSVA